MLFQICIGLSSKVNKPSDYQRQRSVFLSKIYWTQISKFRDFFSKFSYKLYYVVVQALDYKAYIKEMPLSFKGGKIEMYMQVLTRKP